MKDISEWYDFTPHHAEKREPRRWEATATVFRLDTHKSVHFLLMEGTTSRAAEKKVEAAAIMHILQLEKPSDWQYRP